MRELKFRMWDDVLKVMYTHEIDAEIINLWETLKFKGGVFETRKDIKLMQFTGKYDCKNTPIYDGDIIDFDEVEWGGKDHIHKVEWDEENAEWSWGGGYTGDMRWRTVIGNIWENEYLLEKNEG